MKAEGVKPSEIALRLGLAGQACIGCWVSRAMGIGRMRPDREPTELRSRSPPPFDLTLKVRSTGGGSTQAGFIPKCKHNCSPAFLIAL